jgi:hypothetical protein
MALLRMVDTVVYLSAIIPLEPWKSLRNFHPFVKKRRL